jgi:hypothetical protein
MGRGDSFLSGHSFQSANLIKVAPPGGAPQSVWMNFFTPGPTLGFHIAHYLIA